MAVVFLAPCSHKQWWICTLPRALVVVPDAIQCLSYMCSCGLCSWNKISFTSFVKMLKVDHFFRVVIQHIAKTGCEFCLNTDFSMHKIWFCECCVCRVLCDATVTVTKGSTVSDNMLRDVLIQGISGHSAVRPDTAQLYVARAKRFSKSKSQEAFGWSESFFFCRGCLY